MADNDELSAATDPEAAESLPHVDLDRVEASQLLTAVFEESLEAPSGIFGELRVEQFYSDHVAVVGGDGSSLEGLSESSQRNLLQSLLPLRAESEAGRKAVVDLGLERDEGALQPANPLVDVAIPSELGEGISLPESDIGIKLAAAPAERAPSVIGESAAFFPNVAPNSDLTVVPTPTGVEVFSHLRAPDAPLFQRYELSLPQGAVLEEESDGGAEVTRDGAVIAHVPPPIAIDAAGEPVAVSLAVEGDALIVTSAPAPDAAYPILVDPVVETYFWSQNNNQDGLGTDWVPGSNSSLFEARSYGYGGAEKGLNLYSYPGTVQAGAQANWNYFVPRYFSDYKTYGTRPSSFITRMSLSNMNFWIENESAPYQANPFVISGLWDETTNWFASMAVRRGTEGQFFNASTIMQNPNENVAVKQGGVGLHAENDTRSRPRHLWVGQASVEVSDKDYPAFSSAQGPAQWQNGLKPAGEAINFRVSDLGLGVYAVLAKAPKLGGGTNQWEQTPGCPGNARVPCPRIWQSSYWNYDPRQMPHGENVVELIGKDPIWHFSDQVGLQRLVKVKVDRIAPTLDLSGSLTEQTGLGTWQPSYGLKMKSSDGTEAVPQSGAAAVVVTVDGAVAYEADPGCATKNCALEREWTLDPDDYPPGLHVVHVVARDAVGLQSGETLYVETHGDRTAPTVALSGSMTEQATLGTTRPSYKLNVAATDPGPTDERKSGVAAITVKVDGTVVDSASPGCPAGACSLGREWTLTSDKYSPGPHTVAVEATDEAGRTTTRTLTVDIARDTTPPQFQLSNYFYTAPEGWLEQKSYPYNALANDPDGYGVTSISLKIDGNVIKSASQTCPTGGCSRWLGLGPVIDMTSFDGGTHPAELTAIDGAGNVAKRSWAINVDPSGNISVSEATDTMEAVEETAPEATELTPVDGLVTEAVGEEGSNPQLTLKEGELVSEGTPTPSTVALDPADGFAVETTGLSEEGVVHDENIEIAPVQTGPAATDAQLTDGSAAVISNTAANVDTILRPAYDGLMAFQAIRDTTAPESYSWEVKLGEGETLKPLDSRHAGIFWDDGTQAMLIAAQSAHGADGKAVATSLSVSEGNVITLTVDHRASGVVYPVVAGVGWQGGFQTHPAMIEEPPTEEEGSSAGIYSDGVLGAPVPYPMETADREGEASSSVVRTKYLKTFRFRQCSLDGTMWSCGDWEQALKGFFWFNYKKAWYPPRDPACPGHGTVSIHVNWHKCAWVGPNHQRYGGGYHITAQVLYIVSYVFKVGGDDHRHMSVYAYGSGYANEHDTECICNPLPKH